LNVNLAKELRNKHTAYGYYLSFPRTGAPVRLVKDVYPEKLLESLQLNTLISQNAAKGILGTFTI
jgi:hypothetical protein